MEFDTDTYFKDGAKVFTTDSPFPISSSLWLNDPRVRDFVSKHSLRRNHKEVPTTYEITEIIPILQEMNKHGGGFIEAMFTEERRNNPALDEWFKEGFLSNLTTDTLEKYPRGSVGNLFYRFVETNGYVPEFTNKGVGHPQLDYFQTRLSQQHDIEHLLGGFGFEYIGEQGVTWMRHAAYTRYLSPYLAGALGTVYSFLLVPQIMRTMLHYPGTFETVWDVINQGVKVGRASEPIFMMKYEPVLHLSVEEAREALGYREVVEMRVLDVANEWAEGVKVPFDPRLDDDLPQAAE
jgi:ubiquinone biosynthesis protein Coq4